MWSVPTFPASEPLHRLFSPLGILFLLLYVVDFPVYQSFYLSWNHYSEFTCNKKKKRICEFKTHLWTGCGWSSLASPWGTWAAVLGTHTWCRRPSHVTCPCPTGSAAQWPARGTWCSHKKTRGWLQWRGVPHFRINVTVKKRVMVAENNGLQSKIGTWILAPFTWVFDFRESQFFHL